MHFIFYFLIFRVFSIFERLAEMYVSVVLCEGFVVSGPNDTNVLVTRTHLLPALF